MAEQTAGTAGGLSVEGMPSWQLARRQRIVTAALHALEEQEYEQIQIRDVAHAADVALGTLYRYFSSKEHLYAAVLQEWTAPGMVDSVKPRRGSVEQTVRKRVHRVIGSLEQQPRFYKVVMLLQSTADPNARALMVEFATNAQAMLASDFAVLGPDRAQDAATMMWSIINTMLTRSIYHGSSMAEVHRVTDRFIDLLASELR